MSSIFQAIDLEANPSGKFWSPPESFTLDDITQNKIISSQLKLLKNQGVWKTREFILTKTCLYYCQKTSGNPKKMTVIKWKKVEAFTEESEAEERHGFKLGHAAVYQEFYVENVEVLEIWLMALSQVAIMPEFEEDYAIIKEIGKGNYATVYCVHDLEFNKKFAVKQISKEVVSKSSRGASAVISEIEIMRKINHPRIVKLYKVYENENFVSLVLDFVEGGDLYHRIQKKEKFPEEVAANFIINFLDVLKYLHSLNIVHRDLKPENIIMSSIEEDTEFKLCDFGLACIAGDDQVLRCGSPGYVAPEILMKKSYNNKVDIFSAGIILFIILSGRAPFYGKNPNEILLKNKECRLIFHDKYWGHLSRDCINLVIKLTEPDPNERLSAEQALRHSWLLSSGRKMDLLTPALSSKKPEDRSPDSGGSFLLMQRVIDRREMGANITFGPLDINSPYSENKQDN